MKFCTCCSYFGQLKKKKTISSDGKVVGKNLIDIAFDPTLEISHFIVGGGFVEELMESLKLKEDIDPIFDVNSIEEVGDTIKLAVKEKEIGELLDGCCVPDDNYKLSDLMKMDVIDKAGTKIGRINDVAFFDDDCLSFIIGGSATEEFLEKIGVIPDIDLIVPRQNITSVQDKAIKINLTRDELTTTLAEEIRKGSDLKKQSYLDSRKKVSLISRQSLLM